VLVKGQRRYRTFLIVLAYLIMAMMGIRLGIFQEISLGRNYIYSIALALVLTQICIVDSKIMGSPLPIFSYWLIFIFYGIAVPVCIIRARGRTGLVIVAAHYLGLMLVYIASCFITYLFVYSFQVEGF